MEGRSQRKPGSGDVRLLLTQCYMRSDQTATLLRCTGCNVWFELTRLCCPAWRPQLQYSLLDRRPENGMAQYCAARGIALLPYGVLAGGFLSDKYLGVPASK